MVSSFYNEDLFDRKTNENIKEWLNSNCSDDYKKEILKKISSDPSFIQDAFSKKLSFGTGGIRALMRIGSNSINKYTIRIASQGVVNYLLASDLLLKKDRGILIGYDNRHYSQDFAIESAKVFINNGFIVYLYDSVSSISLVSFGVLYTNSLLGIMITASHNPPSYNGYKVFSSYGGQLIFPDDERVALEMSKLSISSILDIKDIHQDNKNKLLFVGKEIIEAYFKRLNSFQFHSDINKNKGNLLKVIYTNLHGTGLIFVPKILNEWGFTSLYLVKEQMSLDGDFPTIKSPNPEEKKALLMGESYLREYKGDILIATDPDCDRVGLATNYKGNIFYFTGNQIACLLAEYICSILSYRGGLKKNHCIVKTLVTTELLEKIAYSYKINILNVLTGFKYIGEKIALWNLSNEYEFLFGAEESQGYLYKDYVRDKDAVLISAMIAEMALHFKLEGKSLVDFLFNIYKKYGWYHARTIHLDFSNHSIDFILKVMARLRERISSSIDKIGNKKISYIEDYLEKNIIFRDKYQSLDNFPTSDVIRIMFEDGSKVVFRPSGTEPKLKLYFEIIENKEFSNIIEALNYLDMKLMNFISEVRKELEI